MKIEDAELILSIVDLPFINISIYEDKGQKPWTGYAAVIKGTRHRYQNWCHDPDEGVWNGQPLRTLNPWHRSVEQAWECFDQNHPGVKQALERLWLEFHTGTTE